MMSVDSVVEELELMEFPIRIIPLYTEVTPVWDRKVCIKVTRHDGDGNTEVHVWEGFLHDLKTTQKMRESARKRLQADKASGL